MSTVQPVPLDEWIAREAVSFSVADDAALHAAVDRVVSQCGPSLEILALGEPTHLVNDYLVLRNRVFQSLVERHGFSAIAIESSFTRGSIADGYVVGRSDSLDGAVDRGITHNMGRMPGNLDLLQWMRQYNGGGPSTPLRFYGFDSPTEMTHADSPRDLLNGALTGLATFNPARADDFRRLIDPLVGEDAAWENPTAMMDPTRSVGRSTNADALRIATEDLIAELETMAPSALSTDAAAYRRATRHAVHARQMLAYHASVASATPNRLADLLGRRDAMMADNLRYAVEQERVRGRLFVFAHNSHLKRGEAVWQWGPNRLAWWPAGAHLAATMRDRYAVVGVGAATSNASGLGPPEPGTLEAALLSVSGPARVIPTRLGAMVEVAAVETRDVAGNRGYFPFGPESLTDFDFLALLERAE